METTTPAEFASAKILSLRWGCKRDTVHARLLAADVARFEFGPKSVRYRWADVVAFELSRVTFGPAISVQVITPRNRHKVNGKRGPVGRRQRVAA